MTTDPFGNDPLEPDEPDLPDIEEFPLLLPTADVSDLIELARRQGLSAAGLARHLICDYLRRASRQQPHDRGATT